MKNVKNVFLTTLSKTKDRLDVGYFVCETATETPSYTTGISVAEAGLKYLLSQYKIDEIIVIGTPEDVSNESEHVFNIMDVKHTNAFNLEDMSEFDFLMYRITEFMNQIDFELLDVGEPVSRERKDELKKMLAKFRIDYAKDTGPSELFLKLCTDKKFEVLFRDSILAKCNQDEKKWIKYHIYSDMDAFYKMHMIYINREATVRFIPVEKRDTLSMEDINYIVNSTFGDKKVNINLYMDMQGLGVIDGNTLISTFLLTNNRTGYQCNVSGLIHSSRDSSGFAGKVSNVIENYKIKELISGLDIFLEYGKAGILKSYWRSLGMDEPDADRIFYGMDCIDEGISLCNVDLIACGINVIRNTIQNPKVSPEERCIYLDIIINAITADFGGLLKGDELAIPELLKWSLRKGLYQQTLTIIESKVPEDIVKRGIYYYARDQKDISKLMKEFNFLYWNETVKMRWAFNEIEHYFIKSYGRSALDFRQKPDMVARDYAKMRVDALHGRTQDILPAYSQLNNDNLLYELLLGYYRIGNLRNQINHAVVEEPNTDIDVVVKHFCNTFDC